MVQRLNPSIAVKNVINNCVFVKHENKVLTLQIDKKNHNLLTPNIKILIDKLLAHSIDNVVINIGDITQQTFAEKQLSAQHNKLNKAQKQFMKDSGVLMLQDVFATKFNIRNIKALEKK